MSLSLPDSSRAQELDPRQIEVLTMMGHGYNDDWIAKNLHMSKANVRFHQLQIRVKLGLVVPPGMSPRSVLWLLACRWEAVSAAAMPVRVPNPPARRVV